MGVSSGGAEGGRVPEFSYLVLIKQRSLMVLVFLVFVFSVYPPPEIFCRRSWG